ncbi:unnamed protein product [Adineta steineri]|uniref:HicB family protein n=2 Tax=Adineta steineri TaxID=433720 RepID=A0A813M9B8_9BILA|nr:unnamed protein product [Adineta steineri]CAF0749556.1 unnamed protein product [Adineta steineri]CAF4230494.1 unnamed protein product [Adineta steineri]
MSFLHDRDISKISLKDNKYHIPFICNIDVDGSYYGCYIDRFFDIRGCVQGETPEQLVKECYESFTMCMEDEEQVPFNVNDIENVVVFDIIKCKTEEEMGLAHDLEKAGKGFNEIMEALNR